MDDRAHESQTGAPNDVFLRDGDAAFRDTTVKLPDTKVKLRSRLRPFLVLGVAILLGFGLYRFATSGRAPTESVRAEETAPVAVATIGTGDINVIVNALGTVTPIATVTVKAQVSGQLLEVAYKEGQIVKKGDFLAQIDPRPFQLAQSQAEGQLIHDQGLLDQARKNLVRFQTLLKQESIARQQAEDQVFLVTQYEGSVKTDQAQIDTQKLNLIYAHIVSPIDGRVGLRLVDAGNYIQTTDTGLAVLTQLSPISVIFIVPEDDIPPILEAVHAGKTLQVAAYDRANVNLLAVGKVATLDNQIDTTTGTVKLRADFDNLDDKLFPNQFVNARLLLKSLRGVVTVPATAIQRGAPGAYVYLVGSDNKVSVRTVELGALDGAMYAVNAGLSPGDRVVVDGADRLRDGAKVLIASGNSTDHGAAPPPAPTKAEPPAKIEAPTKLPNKGRSGQQTNPK
ncbi:efflux transporter periplasmic adaptor subunit [Beijerinckiaceae bacterium]|nr:efflux transporter periplasmic adaptor subunit [Beijerinckiaceae bacterium]